MCLFFLSFFLLLLKKLGVQKPLESPSGCFNGTHVDLKVIRPPVHLCLRTVKPRRAVKNILCNDPPQPASTPSCPSEESLVHPGCWVSASRHCSLSYALWHLPPKKTQRPGLCLPGQFPASTWPVLFLGSQPQPVGGGMGIG